MDETEKDFRKAFEDVTTNNVKALLQYSEETRELVRELQETVDRQNNLILEQRATIEQFKIQLAGVQTALFSGGT